MAKKLHYFNFNGLAESIRYMLLYKKIEFEDVRYPNGVWPREDLKDLLPYGQLPIYQEGDRNLNQSVAIARYVGTISNLIPSDPWEQALLDAVVLTIYDLWNKAVYYVKESDLVRKAEKKNAILNESIDYYFSRFEKEMEKNNGIFGKKLSWADFVFVGIIESLNIVFNEKLETNYPNSVALIKKINNLPGIKEYVATRPEYAL